MFSKATYNICVYNKYIYIINYIDSLNEVIPLHEQNVSSKFHRLRKSSVPGMGHPPLSCRPLLLPMAASQKLKVKSYYWRHHTLWIQAKGTELEQTWKSPTWELTVLVSNLAEQALKGEKSLTVLCSYKDCLLTVDTTWPTTPHSSHQTYSWSHSHIVPSTMHCILNP